jgi:hypothetical protein
VSLPRRKTLIGVRYVRPLLRPRWVRMAKVGKLLRDGPRDRIDVAVHNVPETPHPGPAARAVVVSAHLIRRYVHDSVRVPDRRRQVPELVGQDKASPIVWAHVTPLSPPSFHDAP